jgi:hypothetical protein
MDVIIYSLIYNRINSILLRYHLTLPITINYTVILPAKQHMIHLPCKTHFLHRLQSAAINTGIITHKGLQYHLRKINPGNGITTVPATFVNTNPSLFIELIIAPKFMRLRPVRVKRFCKRPVPCRYSLIALTHL